MTSIFLSYARNDDEAFVHRLYADLTTAGFDVWFDRVSMPSRQLTFHQEIRDAIAARDRLLLVVGPGVLTSDYVTQEWRFAYFEAGKCVNPILRLDGHGSDGAVIDGYELIPEDLKLLHAEDFRDDTQYDQHLQNLIRQLSEPVAPVGKLVAVPELPACFLAQPDRIKALRDLLLVDLQKPVVVSGAAARVGLQGMGGIGKSVLASALAHRPEMRRAFPDGIFWITLGQKPQLAEQQRWLARELGDEALFPDERSGKECLRKLLAGRKALLVLDDVWQREDAEAFNVIGAMGRILLTTRDAGLVTALASKETHYRVELPTEDEAEGIFAAAAHLEPSVLPAAAREIVSQCGRLPLALALCGGMVQGGVSPADVLEALREHDLEFLSNDHPSEEQHRNAWKAMDVSLRVLPPEQRSRFAELAVFALDRGAPEAAVVTLWEHTGDLAPRHARKLLADFAARSLVQLTPAAEAGGQTRARMSLHDLMHNFATGMAEKLFGSRAALHQTLLDAYRKKCPSGWPSGPEDGYFFQSLCGHLLAAGKLDDVVELLTDLPWIEAKCKAKLVFSLQDDYRNAIAAMPEAQDGLRQERVRQARLARWTEEITAYSRQWSERRDRLTRGEVVTEPEPQLPKPPPTCRIWTEEEIEAECQRMIENPTQLDRMQAFAGFVEQECYALVEFGTRLGFVVQHAFNYVPRGPVHEAGEDAAEHCRTPQILWYWPPSADYIPKPALLRTLEGHTGKITNVKMTAGGRQAISAGGWKDGTLRVWDLETGECLRIIEAHIGARSGSQSTGAFSSSVIEGILSTDVTPDGLLAAATSETETLPADYGPIVWDLKTGHSLRALSGHTSQVNCVGLTPDGRRVVSGGHDRTLRVWDLETGMCSQALEGHSTSLVSVCVTADGNRVLSGESSGRLRIWDLETGECRRILEGDSHGLDCVCLTPDGRLALSAGKWGTLSVWDMDTGVCMHSVEGSSATAHSVAVTPDGRRAVSASQLLANGESKLRVWDLATGKCVRVLEGPGSGFNSVSITPDGKFAASAGDDMKLRIWNIQNGMNRRATAHHKDSVIRIYATHGGNRAFSCADCDDAVIREWDMETGACLRTIDTLPPYSELTRDGQIGITRFPGNKTIDLYEVGSGKLVRTLDGHGEPASEVQVTLDGKRTICGIADRTLRVWDLDSGECLRILEGHSDSILGLDLTPDGRRALSWGNDRTLRVWNLDTGWCLRVLEVSIGIGQRAIMTADGRRALLQGMENTLQVWDLEQGTCLRTLEGDSRFVNTFTVTPDGRRAVSGSRDETLRVWDLETGACLAIARMSAPITAVTISPISGRIIVGDHAGEVHQFDLRGMT